MKISRDGEQRGLRPALLYAVCATPVLILLCFLIGPFGSPDEYKHFERIVAISDGYVVPLASVDRRLHRRDQRIAGAPLDMQVEAVADEVDFGRSATDPAAKISLARLRVEARRRPSGHHRFVEHSNTALYPPVIYLPATAGIWIAEASGLPILLWMYCGRLANLVVMTAAVLYAAKRNRPAALAITAVATVPTVAFQAATLSADATMFAAFLLFSSLLGNMMRGDALSLPDRVAMAIATIVLAVGKVAYLPIVLLPVAAASLRPARQRQDVVLPTLVALVSVLLWAGWAWIVRDKVFSMRPDVIVDPAAQVRGIIGDPLGFLHVLLMSVGSDFPDLAADAIGHKLAYNTIRFNKFVCAGMMVSLALAAIAREQRSTSARERAYFAFTCCICALCVCVTYLLLYLQFNPVGRARIEGVQGRYLAPLVILLAVTCPFGLTSDRWRSLARVAGSASVVIAPLLTLAAVVHRYWL